MGSVLIWGLSLPGMPLEFAVNLKFCEMQTKSMVQNVKHRV